MRMLMLPMMILSVGLMACGQDEQTMNDPPPASHELSDDDTDTLEIRLLPEGTLSGHINDGQDFFTPADLTLGAEGRDLRLYGSDGEQEVMIMLISSVPLGQMEPGAYDELTSDFFSRGCAGEERDNWTYDRVGSEVMVIVDSEPHGNMIDYAVQLDNDGGFLTGSAGPF